MGRHTGICGIVGWLGVIHRLPAGGRGATYIQHSLWPMFHYKIRTKQKYDTGNIFYFKYTVHKCDFQTDFFFFVK